MAAGFQRHVDRGAARILPASAAVGKRLPFGVRFPELRMPSFADNAAFAHNDGAHQRIRVHAACSAFGKLQRTVHEAFVGMSARIFACIGSVGMLRQDASFPSHGLRMESRSRALRAESGTNLPGSTRHALRRAHVARLERTIGMAPRRKRRLSRPSHKEERPETCGLRASGARSLWLAACIFFRPDCTVGFGVSPNLPLRLVGCNHRWGLAPRPEDILLTTEAYTSLVTTASKPVARTPAYRVSWCKRQRGASCRYTTPRKGGMQGPAWAESRGPLNPASQP